MSGEGRLSPPEEMENTSARAESSGITKSRSTSIAESLYASTIMSMEEDYKKTRWTMNDQQWVLQRKKIGLSRRSRRTLHAKLNEERSKMSAITYIHTHFNRKECTEFMRKLEGDLCVHCHGRAEQHKSKENLQFADDELFGSRILNAIKIFNINKMKEDSSNSGQDSVTDSLAELLRSPAQAKANKVTPVLVQDTRNIAVSVIQTGERSPVMNNKTLNPSNYIQEFSTNAYGQVEFEGRVAKSAKYLRLADNTTMASVKEFIVDYWHLMKPRPHLALSIVGGAKNFKLDGRKKETFKRGLIAAAQATNAWFLSGGTNVGSMKLIGETVQEGQFLVSDGTKMRRGLKAIGICSWGYIAEEESLVNDHAKEFKQVRYNSNLEIKFKKKPPLDPNHTNFLMVDDGTRNTFISGGGVTDFIGNFEKMVREPEPRGLGVPVITLLLEGGTDSIFKVKDGLEKGQPCVIIEGSGRAADILAYGYRHANRQASGAFTLKEGHLKHIENMLEESYADRLADNTGESKRKMYMNWVIEVIRYSDLITVFDIKTEEDMDKKILFALLKSENLSLNSQLYLSMVWNRVDIAEEKIFSDRTFEWEEDDLAEVMTKALLMERVNFVELLILNGFSMHKFLTVLKLRELYNESVTSHPALMDQLGKYLGHKNFIYLRTIHKYLTVIMKKHAHYLYQLDRPPTKSTEKQIIANSTRTFEKPYMELFIWSVLTNKSNLSEFFWLKSDSPLIAAVFAASFYGKLYHDMYKLRSWDRLRKIKHDYVDKANTIMELAYAKDWDKATSLLDRRYERFGNRSLLNIAYTSQLKSFIANTPCHDAVKSMWRRGFIKISPWPSLLALFCPLLVLTPLFKFFPLGDDGGDLNNWQKIYVFYKAPMVKYIGSFVSYAIFLILYTYVALWNFEWQFRTWELVVYVWLLILIVDETREIFLQPSGSVISKLRDHLSSYWNKLDCFIYILAILGFILKNIPGTFQISRTLFAINAALLYLRMLRAYHANLKLGPKLVIFHKMIPEIVTFMLLLIIFILGYGTASQALHNPKERFSASQLPDFVNNILFVPFWQMFGELDLEHFIPSNKTVCYEDFCEDFTRYNTITLIFLGIYLIIGNVMLLNLLIAIFTSVFEDVQENSKGVWKFEMYRLVEEFDAKPGFPPPLVLFELLYRLSKKIWKLTCRQEKENLENMMTGMLETLDLFEKDSLNSYIQKKSHDENSKMETKIALMEEKIKRIQESLENGPTNSANDWGEDINTEKKLYSSSESPSSSDGEGKIRRRNGKMLKKKRRMVKHVNFQDEEESVEVPTERRSSGKPHKSKVVFTELKDLHEKINYMEENTGKSLQKLETVLTAIRDSLNK